MKKQHLSRSTYIFLLMGHFWKKIKNKIQLNLYDLGMPNKYRYDVFEPSDQNIILPSDGLDLRQPIGNFGMHRCIIHKKKEPPAIGDSKKLLIMEKIKKLKKN
jgi:hypothetical protein